ncbi:tetratricopeptide repeat protein [Legionella anisa]|uniref:tetratricopeptide repeat protein n=1 Tax=Legionella anisa TaxID=28082 RepID=UPI00104149D3|nr:tetratricopeptide repeat protein [Legionella anisa]
MMRCLILFFFSFLSFATHAFSWQDLWSTPDQQGRDLMTKNQFKQAKETFTRSDWAAAAAYRAGDYQKAAELYQDLKNEQGYYNQGNSLAHMGQYEEAIKAYDKALAINSTNQDALYNRKLVEELLKKDKEKNQNKDQQNKDQQNKDQQNKKNNQNNNEAQSEAEREKQQAKEQWLRLIPDDPGGLMREKFLRDHLRRERGWYQ